jgi:predicted alpha/beta superfamily hydrolase
MFAFLLPFGCVRGQDEPDRALTFDVGTYESLHSAVLGEGRTLLVHLPDDYHDSIKRYPVLYALDAEGTSRFTQSVAAISYYSGTRRMPKMIVVGIVNTDRTRDLTPLKIEQRASSGGGDAFLEFIVLELIPHVEGTYRCAPYRILFGGSSAGMFTLYTLFSRPESFSAYIASRSALSSVSDYTWDSDVILRRARELLAERPSLKKFLYMDYGGHEDSLHDPAPIHNLTALFVEHAPDDFRWETSEIGESGYRSAESLTSGLLAVFDGWYYPSDSFFSDGISGGEKHVEGLSQRLGYSIGLADLLSESDLNRLGYQFLEEKRVNEAILFFTKAVDAHPDSRISSESLAEAYAVTQKEK